MSSNFTPSDVVDMSKERDWAAQIGMMDWDNTRIVFTKRTLIEFLKYTGTTVDTNFSNISKLPRYATFGKLSGGESVESETTTTAASAEPQAQPSYSSTFRPTRRVRTAPGGETHDIFGTYADDDDALANAPPRPEVKANVEIQPAQPVEPNATASSIFNPPAPTSQWKPSRRVRENPGGRDSIADIL